MSNTLAAVHKPEDASELAEARVESRLRAAAGKDPVKKFGQAIRQAIDEVLDGPRTGRCSFTELAKTEKTYVGTKVEIVVRTALELEQGTTLDLDIEGYPVDIKWGMNSVWQIPREAVGELCLCIGGLDGLSRFQVGLIRCTQERLNKGRNQDLKRTLSAAGRADMVFLVPSSPLPPNFLDQIDPDVRVAIMSERHIQDRVTRLFKEFSHTPIPRNAVATVARTTGDPMRRIRADASSGNPLGEIEVLSAAYANGVVKALGYPPLERDNFMSVQRSEIESLSESARRTLSDAERARYKLD